MQNFSEEIKKIMDEKNLTIAQVAAKTGYSWQYISDLLKGKRRWNEETMSKVSEVVGLKILFKPKQNLERTGTDNN
jgi:transcriptional regulator with XRE-family HTH domain